MKIMFLSCAIVFGFSVRALDHGFDESNVAEYARAVCTVMGERYLLNMTDTQRHYILSKDTSSQFTDETREWMDFCMIRMGNTSLAFDGATGHDHLLNPDRLMETLILCYNPIQKTVESSPFYSCFEKRNKFEQFAHQVKERSRGR
jgi:hypothetical protein